MKECYANAKQLLVLPPLLINIEIRQVITLWHLKLLSCCIGVILSTFWPIEDGRN